MLVASNLQSPTSGPRYVAAEDVYVDHRGVPCAADHPMVTTLLVAKGASIPMADAVALGLAGARPAAATPAGPAGAAPANAELEAAHRDLIAAHEDLGERHGELSHQLDKALSAADATQAENAQLKARVAELEKQLAAAKPQPTPAPAPAPAAKPK